MRDQNAPLRWRQESLKLHRSALLLASAARARTSKAIQLKDELDYRGPNHWTTAAMLAGYAMEAQFKGIEIAKRCGTGVATQPSKLIHGLLDLAKCAQVGLTSDEQHICSLLTEFTVYLGRYPTPRKLERMHEEWSLSITTFDMYEKMFERVDYNFLYILRAIRDGHWPPPCPSALDPEHPS